jgi:hypothetical protein
MAITLKVLNAPNGEDNSQRRTVLAGTATLTGSYTTGGEAINWATLTSAAGGNVLLNAVTTTPLWAEFQIAIPGATPLLYLVQYNYATNKLQFYDDGSAGLGFAQLGAGAYPADLTAATLRFKAEFANEI